MESPTMARQSDQVALLCDSSVDPGAARSAGRQRHFVSLASLTVLVTCVLALITLILYGREHLGMSERETVRTIDPPEKYEYDMLLAVDTASTQLVKEDVPQAFMETTDSKVYANDVVLGNDEVQVDTEAEAQNDDSLGTSDELQGLLESVGEDPTDPDAVAFLLPLRGHVGGLGMRLGRRLKSVMEQSEKEQVGNVSQFIPSSILVRDTQCEPEITRSLAEHFYEVHGVTRYFGLLTDEEIMTVALWARTRAPGTRFVSPTATSPYLEIAKNVATVQPSANMLASAVADFLLTVQAVQPLVVVKASFHTDAFVYLLRFSGVRPAKVLHYYHTTNMSDLAWRVQSHLVVSSSPVVLLGDAESWFLVEAVDRLISAVWIIPYPTQLCEKAQTKQSELISFIYRAHDDVPGKFLQKQPMLAPMESIVKASHWLLSGGKRWWRGSYVVAAKVAVNSVAAGVRLLGNSDGWLPLLQYDLTVKGIGRRLYQELLVTKDLLKPLLSGDNCSLVIRYQEELTGECKVNYMSVHSSLPTLLVPAERGAQLHVDCRRQHADLRCSAPKDAWAPITCHGSLQGGHIFARECGKEVGIRVAASQGCTGTQGLMCRGGRSLGCLLSGLCTSVSVASAPIYQCDGLNLDTVDFEKLIP
ncbi:uncharacterized protein LOC123518356 [Portunus trituberculatus]|uniref:uncharacterized protein LOC123518356 n=1 Tax=Portunus trituberculatus TaxID=210409 RepID=UPI001E1CF97E|nr:uncharacterized protein LOC123518356 [Portunus trituberculatus]